MSEPQAPLASLSKAALLALIGTLLTGCSTLAPTPANSATTVLPNSHDAELVFLYQSRIADAVLDRSALREIDNAEGSDPVLLAADARMAEVCRFLNEAAISRAEGLEPAWDLRLKVFATTKPCAQAAQEVELLLRSNPSSLATAKL